MNTNRIYVTLDEIKADLKEVRTEQANMRHELTRYKSFWGGILFTFTSISALLGVLWGYVRDVFHT